MKSRIRWVRREGLAEGKRFSWDLKEGDQPSTKELTGKIFK